MGRIEVDLDVMLARRRMTLTELSERVDVTVPNLSILKTGKAKAIRFSTLAAICRELECQPADLLRYVPDPGEASEGVRPAENLE
jgi:putative transcriptional regulator